MAEPIREIADSSEELGNVVAELSKARDMAIAGDRVAMNDALRSAERVLGLLKIDCRVICEIREGEA